MRRHPPLLTITQDFSRRLFYQISMIVFLLSNSGCVLSHKLYEGPRLDDSQTVEISAGEKDVHFSTEFIEFKNVDGEELGSVWKGWPRLIRVLPGKHDIEMRYHYTLGAGLAAMFGGFLGLQAAESSSSHYEKVLTLETFAGHNYTVKYEKVSYSDSTKDVLYWVDDSNTGATIAGQKPS